MTTLSLEIFNPCNERCLHCYRTGDETRRGFLLLAQAQSAIEQAAVFGATDATITGGEVLLNPDWRGDSASGKRCGVARFAINQWYIAHGRGRELPGGSEEPETGANLVI